MDYIKLIKNPRIWLLFIFIIGSIIAIGPHYIIDSNNEIKLETNIKKGLDLQGGVRALLEPQEKSDEILTQSRTVLQTRINSLGLIETKIQIISGEYLQIEMAGFSETELKEILEKQGHYEAHIKRTINLNENQEGTLQFNSKPYQLILHNNNTLELNNQNITLNEKSNLDGVQFKFLNITNNKIILDFNIFNSESILQIMRDAQHSNIAKNGNQWTFQFGIILSNEAARNFAKTTKDLSIEMQGGYLTEDLDFYLDNEKVSSLKISSNLRGQTTTEISISGPGESRESAVQNMQFLQAIIESGSLPTQMKILKIETISPTLGEEFAKKSIIAVLVAIIAVNLIIYLRYKDLKIVIPIIITSLSEILIILGIASLINWTIDLAAIAGIIVAVGTGIDDQIIITDESKYKKIVSSLTQKLKNAFYIIFTAFFTTIAAMLPLLFIGAGGIKGFAITTIIGVTIGVLITRPAYAKVIELLKND
jgi:protein-export membrane protein SecD